MPELYPYPRFSLEERDRRWAAVRARMAEANLDVIVCPNNTGHSTDFQANCRYLSHVGGGGDADIAVVFPLEGEVTAIATSAAPRWPTVQEWTTDVREARRNYGRVAVERLKELGVEHGRIGITGLGDEAGTRTPEGTIGYGFWKQIREGFPEAELVDATTLLTKVRYVKSAEEVDALQKSMDIVEMGIEAKIAAARVGVLDWEVWAAAQYGMMRNGSEIPVHCNWVSGNNPVRTLTRPSWRRLERGDMIVNELEANWMGYRAQAVQPVFVEVVDPVHAELIKVQREVFEVVRAELKPGISVRELSELAADAGRKAVPSSGPAAGALTKLTLHGRGAGDDGPIITSHARDPEHLSVLMEENMVLIFKPAAETPGGTHICTWGDTVVVTPDGGRRMGKRPHELAVAEG
ncbi:MAG: M24 family metallopeptidase [Alphaproteobacteria bacterium]|nr:M24 family metallopeptidase [Alphaproteobacteria bacterium]MCZ6847362.1 M24 family metallopeptidase [Alphaproteobacteria bacterium]